MRNWINTEWLEHYDALPREPIKSLIATNEGKETLLAVVYKAEKTDIYILHTIDSDGYRHPFTFESLDQLLHAANWKYGLPSNLFPFTNIIEDQDYIIAIEASFTDSLMLTKAKGQVKVTFSLNSNTFADCSFASVDFSASLYEGKPVTLEKIASDIVGIFRNEIDAESLGGFIFTMN